ncbi:MAG TPA: hypothetical protein VH969_02915 [Actinophytocola sp.]|jgi:hypothetical protein|uniref:hypothetical protein n=1 Tax=Actinophytocola sp. TaxID=1872138 RepID=UPI002F92EF64
MAGNPQSLPASAAVMTVGVDHVRLLYAYLDALEIDGYASLIDEDAHVRGVSSRDTNSREDAVRILRERSPGAHELWTIEPGDEALMVTGRHTCSTGTVDFADVFTLSECGLIHSHHRVRRG